jgi:uncharacterized phage protein (TIGR01671 family)
MNDRFKFRYWHKKLKLFMSIYGDKDNVGSLKLFKEMVESDRYIVSQCTGLKDKNGKLIYEGDIVKVPDEFALYGMFAGEKREIYFNEGGFRLKPKWDKNSRGNWLEDTEDFEVIGNIYENKELLNE